MKSLIKMDEVYMLQISHDGEYDIELFSSLEDAVTRMNKYFPEQYITRVLYNATITSSDGPIKTEKILLVRDNDELTRVVHMWISKKIVYGYSEI